MRLIKSSVFFPKRSGFILFIEEVLVLRQQWNNVPKPWSQAYKQWCKYRIKLIDSLSVKIVETNDLWNVWDSEWVCIIYLWRGLAALWLHSGITVIHSFHVVTSYFNLLNRTFCLSGKKKLFSSIMCSIKNTLILGWIKVSGQHKRCA